MNQFDRICAVFDGSDMALGEAEGKPKGKAGQRQWKFHLEAVDRDLMEDPDMFVDYLQDQYNISGEVLHRSVEEGDGDDMADEYSFVVAATASTPDESWAIQIKATSPHVEDFDTSATFTLLEDPSKIQTLVNKQQHDHLQSVAASVASSIHGYCGGDQEKILALFDAIKDHPDGGFMRVLEASISGERLDASTPKAKKTALKRRM